MNKSKTLFLLLMLVQLILPTHIALADTGPKPQMEFVFKGTDEGELQIISGELYECDQSDCSDAAPLEKLGPQGLYCDTIGCRATAYGFAPYHILEVEFSDEVTRRSNIFETGGFDSRYTVTVQPNNLLVEKKFSLGIFESAALFIACICIIGIGLTVVLILFFPSSFSHKVIFTLLVTLLVEGLVVFIYSVARKRPAGGLLRASFIVNVFTQVMLWITLNLFFRYYLTTLAIAEVVILLVESVLLVRLSNEQLSLRSAIFLSFCMNLSSFGVGWFLPV